MDGMRPVVLVHDKRPCSAGPRPIKAQKEKFAQVAQLNFAITLGQRLGGPFNIGVVLRKFTPVGVVFQAMTGLIGRVCESGLGTISD